MKKTSFDPKNVLGNLTQAQLDSPGFSGATFKSRRREHEVTQEEVAERTGLTQERISQIENGARMTEETGSLLWNALYAIIYEEGQKKISDARERAQRLRGTPEGEAEAKKAGAWFEGFFAAGGMYGWGPASEKESMEKLIAAQDKMIKSLQREADEIRKLKDLTAKMLGTVTAQQARLAGMESEIADYKALFAKMSEALGSRQDFEDFLEQFVQRRLTEGQ